MHRLFTFFTEKFHSEPLSHELILYHRYRQKLTPLNVMKVFIFIHSASSEASTDKNIWHTLQTVYDIFFMHCLLLLNWKCSYDSHFLGQQLSYFVIIRIVVDCPRRRWYGRLKLIIVPIGIILIQQRISIYYTTGKKNGQELELYPAFNSLTVTLVWLCG